MRNDAPSETALLVAAAIIIFGGDAFGRTILPREIVEVQYDLLDKAPIPNKRRMSLYSLCNPFLAKLVRWGLMLIFQCNVLKGLGFRKSYLESQVLSRIGSSKPKEADGTKTQQQVLVIAAGYDTLAWRLCHDYPCVEFWELDHPTTQRPKLAAVQQMMEEKTQEKSHFSPASQTTDNHVLPANLHFVPVDLSQQPISRVLKDTSFSTKAKTIVIVEGLLMYLTEQQVRDLFHDLSGILPMGSVVAFDFHGWDGQKKRVDLGSWMGRLFLWHVQRIGEPFQWGTEAEDLPHFFEGSPWKLTTPHQEILEVGWEKLACVKLTSDRTQAD